MLLCYFIKYIPSSFKLVDHYLVSLICRLSNCYLVLNCSCAFICASVSFFAFLMLLVVVLFLWWFCFLFLLLFLIFCCFLGYRRNSAVALLKNQFIFVSNIQWTFLRHFCINVSSISKTWQSLCRYTISRNKTCKHRG